MTRKKHGLALSHHGVFAPPDYSGMLVGKGHFFPHGHVRFDRPLEDQDHVAVARHLRARCQLVELLDRLRLELHGYRPGFALSFHHEAT